MKPLKELRAEIDKLDIKLQKLLNERAKLSVELGKTKVQTQKKIYSPEREAEIYQQLSQQNTGPLSDLGLMNIYKQIIAASSELQQQSKIAFLGPLGTFSHEAVVNHFGQNTNLEPQTTITQVFKTTERKEVDYGLVPIENSTEGVVNKTLNCWLTSNLTICAEIVLPIHQCLLSREKNLHEITQIYSHQQALAQCQNWLEKNLPKVALMAAKSTSQACMLAARETNTAAIAGTIALEHHKLNILAQNIEDDVNNMTRFYVIDHQPTKPTGRDKTAALIWLPHTSGALASLLNTFAKYKINLTLIESRPSKEKSWEYYFFVEMEGHTDDKAIKQALQLLAKNQIKVKILGSFPRGPQ